MVSANGLLDLSVATNPMTAPSAMPKITSSAAATFIRVVNHDAGRGSSTTTAGPYNGEGVSRAWITQVGGGGEGMAGCVGGGTGGRSSPTRSVTPPAPCRTTPSGKTSAVQLLPSHQRYCPVYQGSACQDGPGVTRVPPASSVITRAWQRSRGTAPQPARLTARSQPVGNERSGSGEELHELVELVPQPCSAPARTASVKSATRCTRKVVVVRRPR